VQRRKKTNQIQQKDQAGEREAKVGILLDWGGTKREKKKKKKNQTQKKKQKKKKKKKPKKTKQPQKKKKKTRHLCSICTHHGGGKCTPSIPQDPPEHSRNHASGHVSKKA